MAARQLLKHLQQGTPVKDPSSRLAHRRNTISSSASPALNFNESNNPLEQQQEGLQSEKNRMELRYKLELMQKLQTELLQMIEGQDENDGMKAKSIEDENTLGLDNSSNNDDAMKELLEEHSSLLKRTLLISTRRKSIGSKTPHRGDLALDLNGSMSANSTWPDFFVTDDKEHPIYEKEAGSSPRFSHIKPRSRNLSKENVPIPNTASLVTTGTEASNQIPLDIFDVEKTESKMSTKNHPDISTVKGRHRHEF